MLISIRMSAIQEWVCGVFAVAEAKDVLEHEVVIQEEGVEDALVNECCIV